MIQTLVASIASAGALDDFRAFTKDTRSAKGDFTQVVVDQHAPGFGYPTKPVGPSYGIEEAARLERELGWQPETTAEQGIRSTVAWYLKNRWWWQPIRDKGTSGDRLGLGAKAPARADAG